MELNDITTIMYSVITFGYFFINLKNWIYLIDMDFGLYTLKRFDVHVVTKYGIIFWFN